MTAVYLQLAAYACATTFSPGPNNILLFSSTSRYGIRKCWPLIFGIWAGLITVMLLCGFGICEAWTGIRQIYGFACSNHSLFRVTGTFFNPGPYAGFVAVAGICGVACIVRRQNLAARVFRSWSVLRRQRPAVLILGVAPYLLGWGGGLHAPGGGAGPGGGAPPPPPPPPLPLDRDGAGSRTAVRAGVSFVFRFCTGDCKTGKPMVQ